MKTKQLLKLARYGVNYGVGPLRLSAILTFRAFPNKVTCRNCRRLIEEILAQGTFGKFYRMHPELPIIRIRKTRRIK